MPRINAARLLNDLHTLRGFGATGTGVVRTTYSDVDMDSRRWLRDQMQAIGLNAVIDGVGNVIGRSDNPGKSVLIGSHSDTQPTGGWLDGALGVIYGLEVARSLSTSKETAHLAIDVASWADEESSFLGLIGSRSFCGCLEESEIEQAIGRDGSSLVESLLQHDLYHKERIRFDPLRHGTFLEAHIEQGPYLEAEDKVIGIVSSIIGMRDFSIEFSGQQNHAGTTPMLLRKDAGMGLIKFANDLDQAMQEEAGNRTVWTIGNVQFDPGAPSIIPGSAVMRWQFRDPEESRIERLIAVTERVVDEFNGLNQVQATLTLIDESARATPMNEGVQRHLSMAADQHCPDRWISMPSGAAHDAQTFAPILPTGMLFIPSIGGVSHSFEEDSHERDIVLGCQVLADAAATIAKELNQGNQALSNV